jgi:hypothetical protein
MARLVGPASQLPHQGGCRGHQRPERLLPVRQLKHFQAQAIPVVIVQDEVTPLFKGNRHAENFTHGPNHRFGQGIQAHRLIGVGEDFQNIQALVQGWRGVLRGGSGHRDSLMLNYEQNSFSPVMSLVFNFSLRNNRHQKILKLKGFHPP